MKHSEKTEAPAFSAFMGRILRSFGRRAGTDTELLAAMCQLRMELDRTIVVAAQELHANGLSWTEIGAAVGISRQAARQAWAPKGES